MSHRPTATDVFTMVGALVCVSLSAAAVPADAAPLRMTGNGFVTDRGHPMNPADFHKYDITAHVAFDPVPGEALIVLEYGAPDGQGVRQADRYQVRRGRIFQVDAKGAEVLPEPFGDVNAPAVAALHPALVMNALRERPECVRRVEGGLVFAWNDELWTIDLQCRTSLFKRGAAAAVPTSPSGGRTAAVRDSLTNLEVWL